MWVQDKVANGEIEVRKVDGKTSLADMLTKHLARADLERHLEFSGLILCAGRADGSLHVSGLSALATCSFRGGLIEAAIRSAANSFFMMGSSKVGLGPLQPRAGTNHAF